MLLFPHDQRPGWRAPANCPSVYAGGLFHSFAFAFALILASVFASVACAS